MPAAWDDCEESFGGTGPYHFQLDTFGGFPPIGMFLGKDGQLTGTPDKTSAGKTYLFTVCAVDLSGDFICRQVSLNGGRCSGLDADTHTYANRHTYTNPDGRADANTYAHAYPDSYPRARWR